MDPYDPPAVAYVGNAHPVRGFSAPKSFIKSTTYHFGCDDPDPCYVGHPYSEAQYSYWNARGSFRAKNPNAPTTTATIRFAMTMSNPNNPPTVKIRSL